MFDTAAPLARLVAVLTALPGMQTVYVGVPESIGPQVAAYVALAGQDVTDRAGYLAQRTARYFVAFAYAVAGAEATAETTIATLADAFLTALLAERRTGLAGTADQLRFNFALGDGPDYQPLAGSEYRIFPVLVEVVQQQEY